MTAARATLFFLDVQSLDDGFVAVLQLCFARERHRNGHAEPLLHRFADGAVGMALFEQIESAVQQLYCKGTFVYGAACVLSNVPFKLASSSRTRSKTEVTQLSCHA